MNKKILLLLLFLNVCFGMQGQTVFAPPNSIWHYGFINSDGEDGLNYTKYVTEKDTVFEGQLCSKVNANKYYSPTTFSSLQTEYVYTANDTVFYYNYNFKKFLALYVFNVAKGDTLKFHVPYVLSSFPDTFRIVVDTVYSITIKGVELKTVKTRYLDHFALDRYTERIGNSNFIGHRYTITTGGGYYLNYYQDGDIDTNFTDKPCEYLKTSIKDIPASEYKYLVYPNPFSNQIIIDFGEDKNKFTIQLYDVFGKNQIQFECSNGTNCSVNTSELPTGLYFIKIINDTQEDFTFQPIFKL